MGAGVEGGLVEAYVEVEHAEVQRNLADVYGERVITLFGITGSIRELSDACTASEEKRTQEADSIFVVNALNEAGEEVDPEDAPFFEKILKEQGEEIKFTIRHPKPGVERHERTNKDAELREVRDGTKVSERKEKNDSLTQVGQSVLPDVHKATAREDAQRESTQESDTQNHLVRSSKDVAEVDDRQYVDNIEVRIPMVSHHVQHESIVEPAPEQVAPSAPALQSDISVGAAKPQAPEAQYMPSVVLQELDERVPDHSFRERSVGNDDTPMTAELLPGTTAGNVLRTESQATDRVFDLEVAAGATEGGESGNVDQEAVGQVIREILDYQPSVELHELFVSTESHENGIAEIGEDEPLTIFEKLDVYVEDLRLVKPERADRLAVIVEEITQVSETLVELQALQSISEMMDEAIGVESEGSVERRAEIMQIKIRLEAICIQLFEEIGIEPRPEFIAQFIEECMATALVGCQARRLTPEELAHKYMHNVKLATSFTNFQRDAQALVYIAAQLLMKRLFPVKSA